MEDSKEGQWTWLKRNWRFLLALVGSIALTVLMIFGVLATGQFLSAVGAWFILFALFTNDVSEITLGTILGIKRDVQAARTIREQVKAQAEEIRIIRDQVEVMQSNVTEQAKSIDKTVQAVVESRVGLEVTIDHLQKLTVTTVEVITMLVAYMGYARKCDRATGTEKDFISDVLFRLNDRMRQKLGKMIPLCEEAGMAALNESFDYVSKIDKQYETQFRVS